VVDDTARGRPIDLHTHSVVSDGTETPAELVAAALAAGLGTLAITDHDSTAGWAEAIAAAEGTGLTVLPGLELSTQLEYASVHVLGYLVDPADADLLAEMSRIRQERLGRAEAMVGRIAKDYDLSWADVIGRAAPGATIGRPHIADALVAKGILPEFLAGAERRLAAITAAYEEILSERGLRAERALESSP